jgi:hypothetical protein
MLPLIGLLAMLLGVLWFVSRLLNAPTLYRGYCAGKVSLWRWVFTEAILGYGLAAAVFLAGTLMYQS